MNVLSSCSYVTQNAKAVIIDESAVISCAKDVLLTYGHPHKAVVPWEGCNFHTQIPPSELLARYCFLVNCMNFCFWPAHKQGFFDFEYEDLAGCLSDIFEKQPEQVTPDFLSNVSEETIKEWFVASKWSGSQHPIGLMPSPLNSIHERARYVREVGQLLKGFSPSSTPTLDFIRTSLGPENNAQNLVEAIAAHLPGFRDSHVYKGRQIFIYKRAQILVADLWAAFLRLGPDSKTNPCAFDNMEKLTMFADYRVPQILFKYNVLRFDETENGRVLWDRIQNGAVIAAGSEDEIEIRASTIVACNMIAKAMNKLIIESENEEITSAVGDEKGIIKDVEVDWLFWQVGEANKHLLPPFHKTETVFY